MEYQRYLDLQKVLQKKSLLLLGPRQTGKTTLVRTLSEQSFLVDLTETNTFREFSARPELLRQRLPEGTALIVIDEAQRIPDLFNEVQALVDRNKQLRVLMTGSSARKLRRQEVNLLPGRIWKRQLHPLLFPELGSPRIEHRAERGSLPGIIDSEEFAEELKNYVGLYLEEEIYAESVTRNIGAFGRFLQQAALCHTEQLNYTEIARDLGVAPNTIRAYFQVLYDTLVAVELPAFRHTPTRKAVSIPKFYFFDPGVVNGLLNRFQVPVGSDIFGKAFESILFQELRGYLDYTQKDLPLSYWRSASQFEVDFLLGDAIAIEVKAKPSVNSRDERGIRALSDDIKLKRKIIVCLESARRRSDQGVEIIPATDFLEELWGGGIC